MSFRADLPRPVRLEFADDMFARGHRGVGGAVVTQRAWRLADSYDAGRLREIAGRLARGRLARRIQRALIPAARDAWSTTDDDPVLALDEHPIDDADVLGWLAERHTDPVDPHDGPGWRLAATNLRTGGAVVSLTVAHAVADGAAITDAVVSAATDVAPPPLPDPGTGRRRIQAEVRDAAAQIGAIGEWARARLRARLAGCLPTHTPAAPTPAPVPNAAAASWTPPRVVAEFDTAAAATAAARHGGSLNAWFVAVAASILDRIGHTAPDAPIPISVPISGFVPGDVRSNSTRIARVEVDRAALAARDLAVVRSASKEAYTRVRDAGPGLAPIPLPLVQMLPDLVLRRLPQPPQAACLASNLGALPDPFVQAMGPRVRSVATAANYQRLTAEQARRVGGGLLAWHAAAGPRSTLTLIPAEPDRVPDAAAFARLVVEELASWDVPTDLW